MGKRIFDLSGSLLGLVVLFPFLLVVALAVKLGDGGPVFFRQVRIGRGGRPFRIWKFRTMVSDAERLGSHVTVAEDPRITRIGRFLRSTRLDELPQLLNVLSGEMSFVGPRPEVPRYVDLGSDLQQAIFRLRPGITDLASIRYLNEGRLLAQVPDPEEFYARVIAPDKLRLSLAYEAGAGLWSDFLVILATLRLFPPERVWKSVGLNEPP